jgi:hypothetical protein
VFFCIVDVRDLAVWLPAFSWTKERVLPQLEALAEAGFAAVTFDLCEHGERLMKASPIHCPNRMEAGLFVIVAIQEDRVDKGDLFWTFLTSIALELILDLRWSLYAVFHYKLVFFILVHLGCAEIRLFLAQYDQHICGGSPDNRFR